MTGPPPPRVWGVLRLFVCSTNVKKHFGAQNTSKVWTQSALELLLLQLLLPHLLPLLLLLLLAPSLQSAVCGCQHMSAQSGKTEGGREDGGREPPPPREPLPSSPGGRSLPVNPPRRRPSA